jgi:hypothetical protein
MHHLRQGSFHARNVGFNPEGHRKLRDRIDRWMERPEDSHQPIMAVTRAGAASIAQEKADSLSSDMKGGSTQSMTTIHNHKDMKTPRNIFFFVSLWLKKFSG